MWTGQQQGGSKYPGSWRGTLFPALRCWNVTTPELITRTSSCISLCYLSRAHGGLKCHFKCKDSWRWFKAPGEPARRCQWSARQPLWGLKHQEAAGNHQPWLFWLCACDLNPALVTGGGGGADGGWTAAHDEPRCLGRDADRLPDTCMWNMSPGHHLPACSSWSFQFILHHVLTATMIHAPPVFLHVYSLLSPVPDHYWSVADCSLTLVRSDMLPGVNSS